MFGTTRLGAKLTVQLKLYLELVYCTVKVLLKLAHCAVKLVFGSSLLYSQGCIWNYFAVELKFCLELAYNTVNVGFGASSLCS